VCSYSSGTIHITHNDKRDSGKDVVTTAWETISFDTVFDYAPVVVAEISSEHGNDTVYINVKNVTVSSFEVQIVENLNSGWDGGHIQEEVSWYAVQNTQSDVLVGILDSNADWHHIAFATAFGSVPKVITTIQTENGGDLAYSDIGNVTTTGFDIRVEEPIGWDEFHTTEKIGWIALDSITGAEVNKISCNHEWQHIDFVLGFTQTPILVTELSSANGGDKAKVDVRNLDKDGFEVRVEEDPLMQDIAHINEDISYIAIANTYPDRQFGKRDIDTNWVYVPFDEPFGKTPIVLVNVVTENGLDTVAMDINVVNTAGFLVRIEEDLKGDWDNHHTMETINYLAMQSADTGEQMGTLNISTTWTTVTFGSPFASVPKVFADIQTENGADTVDVDIRNVTNVSFDIKLEEDIGVGWDGGHTDEKIGWWAFITPASGESGKINLNHEWKNEGSIFSGGYSTTPYLLYEINTENGLASIIGDIKELDKDGFQIRVEEEPHYYDGWHANEDISYYAW